MKFATINIWSGLDYQGRLRCGEYESASEREHRYRHLVNRLHALDADVIAVNEANPVASMMKRLAADLNYDQIHWRGLSGVRLGRLGIPCNLDEGDGILARRNLGLTAVGRTRLTGGWLGRWGSLNFSNATQMGCGRIQVGDTPFFIFNTHWTVATSSLAYAAQSASRDGEEKLLPEIEQRDARTAHRNAAAVRQIESERTLHGIQQLLPTGINAILAGDFNTVPGSSETLAIERFGFIDAFRSLHPEAEGATWDPKPNDMIRKFYAAAGSHSASPIRIDYIFITERLRPFLSEAYLALDKPDDRPHPSDHFALVCEVGDLR